MARAYGERNETRRILIRRVPWFSLLASRPATFLESAYNSSARVLSCGIAHVNSARCSHAAARNQQGRGKGTAPMTSRFAPLALAAICILAGGCGNRGQSASAADNASSPAGATTGASSSNAAAAGSVSQASSADQNGIRAAIEDHLRGNSSLNLDAMDMVVDSIAIHGDQAQAHASFHVKNGGATGMTMQYFLQRSGNGWIVTNGQPADGNTQLPPSANPHSGTSTTQSTPSIPDVNAFFKDHPAPKSN